MFLTQVLFGLDTLRHVNDTFMLKYISKWWDNLQEGLGTKLYFVNLWNINCKFFYLQVGFIPYPEHFITSIIKHRVWGSRCTKAPESLWSLSTRRGTCLIIVTRTSKDETIERRGMCLIIVTHTSKDETIREIVLFWLLSKEAIHNHSNNII